MSIDTLGKSLNKFLRRFNLAICRIDPVDRGPTGSPIELNSVDTNNAFFGNPEKVASYVNKDRLEFFAALIDWTVQQGVSYQDVSVVDVGCGPGALLALLRSTYPTIRPRGLDFSDACIMEAKRRVGAGEYTVMDVYALSGRGEQHDVVYCTEVLEHLLYPTRALREILSLAKPGGHCLLTVPNGRNDFYQGHINFWSPESWRVFVEETVGDAGKVTTGLVNGVNAALILLK